MRKFGTWEVIQSKTDPEMYAVKGLYLVADNLPIEDAHLIASAPDLLDALRHARGIVSKHCDGHYEAAVLDDIDAAIAKAGARS